MMFRPRASHDLRLINASLSIAPQPANLHWFHDVFDNSVAMATFAGATAELRFESVVMLEHFESASPEGWLEPGARTYPFTYSSDELAGLAPGMVRRYPTEDVRRWARHFLAGSVAVDTMSLLRSMTEAINKEFEYRRRVERGVQTPSDTLRRGHGTCRDFALLMIEGVRSPGTGRPVRKWLLSLSPTPRRRWLPGEARPMRGWRCIFPGLDGSISTRPTRSSATHNLIPVAVAWDHSQVMPLWGTFIGRRSAFLEMEVTVSVLDETPSSRDASAGEPGLQEFAALEPASTGLP